MAKPPTNSETLKELTNGAAEWVKETLKPGNEQSLELAKLINPELWEILLRDRVVTGATAVDVVECLSAVQRIQKADILKPYKAP